MLTLLETAHEAAAHNPTINIAIGVAIFCLLMIALAIVVGVGSSRPHAR